MNQIATHTEQSADTVLMHCEIFFAKDSTGHVQPPVASTMAISASTFAETVALAPTQDRVPVSSLTNAKKPPVAHANKAPAVQAISSRDEEAPATTKAVTSIAALVPSFLNQATEQAKNGKQKKGLKAPRVKKANATQLNNAAEKESKPRVPYNPKARSHRMRSILMTIIEMAGDETEITVNKIKARMEDELLPQIKSGIIKEESIGADINTALKIMGGMVELRRDPSPRGRPYAVYAFDPSKLTERGKEIHSAIYLEWQTQAQTSKAI